MPQTVVVDVRANDVLRVAAVQNGIDVKLTLSASDIYQVVDSPLQRNATEYLTVRIAEDGPAIVTVESVDEDYVSGTVDLLFHRLHEKTDRDALAISSELALTEGANAETEEPDWAARAESYEQIGRRFEQLAWDTRAADALMRSAMVHYWYLFDWPRSAVIASEARQLFFKSDDRWNGALALDLEGAALIELANEDQSDERLRQTDAILKAARDELRAAKDTYNTARVINNVGLLHFYHGNFDVSEDAYEEAFELFSSMSEEKWQVITLQNLLLQDFELRRGVANAPDRYEELLALIDKERSPNVYVDVLNNAALANTILGNLAVAVQQFDEALDLWRDNPERGRIYEWLALVFIRGGDFERAEGILETANELYEKANDLKGLAAAERMLGNIYRYEGAIDKAIEAHRASYAAHKSEFRKAEVAVELVRDYLAKNDLQAAKHQLRNLKKTKAAEQAPNVQASIHLFEGHLATLVGHFEEAQTSAQLGLDVANHFGLWDRQFDAHIALADIFDAQKNISAMRQSLLNAISIIEDARANIGSPQLRATMLARHGDPYDRVVASYFDEISEKVDWSEQDQTEVLGKILALLDQSRNRVLKEQLGRSNQGKNPSVQLAAAMAKHERLVYEFSTKDIDREELDGNMESIARLSSQLLTNSSSPGVSESLPVSIKDAQAQLGENQTIVSYWIARKSSKLFVLRRDTIDLFDIGDAATIRAAVDDLIKRLSQPGSNYQKLARSIDELRNLVLPSGSIGDQDQVIYAQVDDALHNVPYSLLVDDGKTVVKVLSIYPDESPTPAEVSSASLVIANGGAWNRDEPTILQFNNTQPRQAYLPHVQDEVIAIRSYMPKETTKFLIEDDATRSSLSRDLQANLRTLHIAAHAYANTTMPELSWIQLADGKIFAAELERLRLSADLVVLSACETARGRLIQREGTFGLARSFFVAGATSVIASLWQVSDKATAELFEAFYDNSLQRGFSIPQSLKLARSVVRGNARWRHPYYWSGFEVWQKTPFQITTRGEH